MNTSTTFVENTNLPVHRWFRYSAGYSGAWAYSVLREKGSGLVLDPFAGVGTTLIAAQLSGWESIGIEAHPLVQKINASKLLWSSNCDVFAQEFHNVLDTPIENISLYHPLISKIYSTEHLNVLYSLKRSILNKSDLSWLCLLSILRKCSHVGTAPWQYVLPKKSKLKVLGPLTAFRNQALLMIEDMGWMQDCISCIPTTTSLLGDARSLPLEDDSIDFILSSPPYPNNFDYADATRIELSFLGEVERWKDLHDHTRKYLMVSCSQHARSEKQISMDLLSDPILLPIMSPLTVVCNQLMELRQTRKGKKHYHTMIVGYFRDMAKVLSEMARVLKTGSQACLVIGDSAPYGVHIPVEVWISQLGRSVGLLTEKFEQTRIRNTKWKNRKHTVPLKEGILWLIKE